MRVTMLPSTFGGSGQALSSYLVGDDVCVDAGSVGLFGTPEQQSAVRHVLLTHTHIDHLASLAVLVDNVYRLGSGCVTVHATAPVLECLQSDVFNNRLFPDMIGMGRVMPPFLELNELRDGVAAHVGDFRVTPVAVDHVVPTVAYLLEDAVSAVAVVTDTGPTEEVWKLARRERRLAGVFLEASFPESEAGLAKVSKHLTPSLFAAEARKLPAGVPVYAIHLKPRFACQVENELAALGMANVSVARAGREYCFGGGTAGRSAAT